MGRTFSRTHPANLMTRIQTLDKHVMHIYFHHSRWRMYHKCLPSTREQQIKLKTIIIRSWRVTDTGIRLRSRPCALCPALCLCSAPVSRRGVHDDPLEAHAHDSLVIRHLIEFGKGGLGSWQPEQVLRGDNYQRLPELPVDLWEGKGCVRMRADLRAKCGHMAI